MSRPRAYAAQAQSKRTAWDGIQPVAQITCFRCGEDKPQTGAVKFHAHLVCVDCAKKLQSLDTKGSK
jgi:formylmethanofuran dehydrogenase subunit E